MKNIIVIDTAAKDSPRKEYGVYSSNLTDAVRELFGDFGATAYYGFYVYEHDSFDNELQRAMQHAEKLPTTNQYGRNLDTGERNIYIQLGNGKKLMVSSSAWGWLATGLFTNA